MAAWRNRHSVTDLESDVTNAEVWCAWQTIINEIRTATADHEPSQDDDSWAFIYLDGEEPTYVRDGIMPEFTLPHPSTASEDEAVQSSIKWIYETSSNETLRLIRAWFGGLKSNDVAVEGSSKNPPQAAKLAHGTKVHILNHDCLFLRMNKKPLRAEGRLYFIQENTTREEVVEDMAGDDLAVRAMKGTEWSDDSQWEV